MVGVYLQIEGKDRGYLSSLNSVHLRYDLNSFNHATRKEDEVGLYRSAKWMHDLITREELEHGIPSNRIIIGGISQGGAAATMTALTTEKPLAGLFSLSSFIPLRKKITEASFDTLSHHPSISRHQYIDRNRIHKENANILGSWNGRPSG